MHEIYEVMYEGFCEVLNGVEPDFDKHENKFLGLAYESGRFLAIAMTLKGADTSEVTAFNIFNFKSKYRKEV